MGTIFVAGVHAVGKTTCCMAATKQLGYPHFSASEIIKAEKSSAVTSDSKEVRDVTENQQLLIRGVDKILNQGKRCFFLDGHFTLLDAKRQIQAVDVAVFAQLRIDSVVVYQDDPKHIQARLKERDNRFYDAELIAIHQNAELAHAEIVSLALQIPIIHLHAFDSSGLIQSASSTWGG